MLTRRAFLKNSALFGTACLVGPLASCGGESDGSHYDTIIRNGTLYDGTETEPHVADVGIRGDRIAAVGYILGTADRVIDATNCIITPGFIDVHDHSDLVFYGAGAEREQAAVLPIWAGNHGALIQGVTTVVSGNCGYGFTDMDEYYEFLDNLPFGSNTYYLTPHGMLRLELFGKDQRSELNAAQLDRLKGRVADEMEKGAIGLSTGLGYAPGYLATTNELVELARVARRYGGLYVSHIRHEPDAIFGNGNADILKGIEEAIDVGRRAEVPVQISHIKGYIPCTPDVPRRILETIEKARSEGIDVTADQYPYTAASTVLSVLVPPEYRTASGIRAEYRTSAGRQEIRAAVERTFRTLPPERVLISSWESYHLQTLREIADDLHRAPSDVFVEMACLDDVPGGTFFMIDEAAMEALMPSSIIFTGSDGGALPSQASYDHPRQTGSFARKLRVYALARGLMTLQEAILSMTSRPAEKFGLTGRGKIEAGNFADIAVIDPLQLRDCSTYQEPSRYSEGVRHVFVNGAAEVDDGAFTGIRSGRALRRA